MRFAEDFARAEQVDRAAEFAVVVDYQHRVVLCIGISRNVYRPATEAEENARLPVTVDPEGFQPQAP